MYTDPDIFVPNRLYPACVGSFPPVGGAPHFGFRPLSQRRVPLFGQFPTWLLVTSPNPNFRSSAPKLKHGGKYIDISTPYTALASHI